MLLINNIFESENLIIRKITSGDIEEIYSYRSLEEIARYQYWEPFSKEEVMHFVTKCKNSDMMKENEWHGFAIILKKNGTLIGDCALNISAKQATIGCNISPQYQKNGFAKETLIMLFNYCFNIVDVREIYGIADAENAASINLMKSLGMEKSDWEEEVMCKNILILEVKYLLMKSNWKTPIINKI